MRRNPEGKARQFQAAQLLAQRQKTPTKEQTTVVTPKFPDKGPKKKKG